MVREGPPQPPPYPAEKARGGEIIRTLRLLLGDVRRPQRAGEEFRLTEFSRRPVKNRQKQGFYRKRTVRF
jgi:hypothetical protein